MIKKFHNEGVDVSSNLTWAIPPPGSLIGRARNKKRFCFILGYIQQKNNKILCEKFKNISCFYLQNL